MSTTTRQPEETSRTATRKTGSRTRSQITCRLLSTPTPSASLCQTSGSSPASPKTKAVRFDSLQPDGASGAFPVTFDLLWPALGYADHQEAAEVLMARFTVGQDYMRGTRRTYLTMVTAQLMAHTAPGPDAASVRGMYARVHERAQEHDVLTRLQEVFHAARLARHESVLANCLERGYVYLPQPMLINGIWRAKPGHTDGTLKERYHGLRSQFGSGESQFLFDRVARAVEDVLLTKSILSRKR